MRLINLRPYRGPLLLLALLAALLSLGVVRVTAATSYAQAVFVSGAWGVSAAEFGRGTDAIGRAQGPCAFAIDAKGGVLVADTANRRILRFDAKGQPDRNWQVQEFSGLAASAIAVDGRGQVYVGDVARGRVICLDSRGGHAGEVDLAVDGTGVGGWTLYGLAGHPQSGFYAMLAGWPAKTGGIVLIVRPDPATQKTYEVARYTLPHTGLEPEAADAAQGLLPADFCTGPGGSLALIFRTGVFGLRLTVINDRGEQLWSREISRESVIRRAALFGADKRGNYYVALDYGDTAEVLSIGSRGEPAVAATIPSFRPPPSPGGHPYALFPGRVDQQGRMYLVANTEDGFRLVRLTPSARPLLRWWFR